MTTLELKVVELQWYLSRFWRIVDPMKNWFEVSQKSILYVFCCNM